MALLRPPAAAAPPEAPQGRVRPFPRHPDPTAVRELLAGLLDKPITVTVEPGDAERARRDAASAHLLGTYVGQDDEVEAVSLADLGFVAAAGAALALVPAVTAAFWVEEGRVPDDGVDNAAEVLNVLAATLNDVNPTRHVRMVGSRRHGEIDLDHLVRAARSVRRCDAYTIDIDGFAPGHLTFVSC